MKNRLSLITRPAVLLGAVALTASVAAMPWPYLVGFEEEEGFSLGVFSGDSDWTLSAPLSAEIGEDAASGTQGLALVGPGWLALDASADSLADHPVAWVDFYLRPGISAEDGLVDFVPPTGASATAFLRSGAEAEVYALDGNGTGGGAWLPSGRRLALDGDRASSWRRFTYRFDYQQRKWDLFLDGNLVFADLRFHNADAFFKGFAIRAGATGATGLDGFYAGTENPLFADANNDGVPDSWLVGFGLNPSSTDRRVDSDRDGVTLLDEYRLGLDPIRADTDGDGVWDRREILSGKDAARPDVYSLGSVPFVETFEEFSAGAFVDGSNLWSVSAGDAETVEVRTGAAPEGANALSMRGASSLIERSFADCGGSAVWLDFKFRPTPRQNPPEVPADVAAAFYFDLEGRLWVLDGGTQGGGIWRPLSVANPGLLQPNVWLRLTARMDYALQSWSVWLNNREMARGLGFANHVPFFSGIRFAHRDHIASTSGLDAFSAGTSEPAGFDEDLDGVSNADETALGTSPQNPDTDGDGMWDGDELAHGLDPLVADPGLARLTTDGSGASSWSTRFSAAEGYALDADLDGQLGWRATNAAVTAAETAQLHSSESGGDSRLDRLVGADGTKRLWFTFRARFRPGALPVVDQAAASPFGLRFGFPADEWISIYNPATAQWLKQPFPAHVEEWNNYALYLDYESRRWLVTVNGRLVARDLPLGELKIKTLSWVRFFQASGAGSGVAQVDDMKISTAEPPELDYDGDGISNAEESVIGLDLFKADTDGDGMPDGWERAHGLDPLVRDAAQDLDRDTLTALDEYHLGTDPRQLDQRVIKGLVAELWRDLPGSTLNDLLNSPRFPFQPTELKRLDQLSLPFNYARDYGTRVRGYLLPPSDGDYVFWTAADAQVALWLSPTDSPYDRQRIAWQDSRAWGGEYGAVSTQRSSVIRLQAGMAYYFEVVHKGGNTYDQLNVAWYRPHGQREIISADHVASFVPRPDDLDDDGLPDVWETQYGLGAAQGYALHGAYGDFDGDRLSNLEEYQVGTDPTSPDTDGDGMGDYEAVRLLGVDPTAGLFDGDPVTVVGTPGSGGVAVNGDWESVDGGMEARALRGAIAYDVALSSAGIFRLDLVVRDAYEANPFRHFDVDVKVDGLTVGRLDIYASGAETGLGQLYLPWLDVGAHRIELVWHNGRPQSFLRVESLALINPSALDADDDGVADWMESRLDQTFSVDAETVQTAISPFTLEGGSLYPQFLSATARYKRNGRAAERLFAAYGSTITADAPRGQLLRQIAAEPVASDTEEPNPTAVDLTVEVGLARRFFAHVPLDPEAPVRVRVREGAGVRTVTKKLVWKPLNLLTLEAGSELQLRDFDRLLVSAKKLAGGHGNSAPVELTLVRPDESEELYTLKRQDVLELGFDQAGVYRFWVQPKNEPERLALTVEVFRIELDPAPITIANALREWSPSALPEAAAVQADSTVLFDEKLPVQNPRRFVLSASAVGGSLVARLGGESGPLADALRLKPVVSYHGEKSAWDIVQIFSDGTELWKGVIDLGGPVPPGLNITMRVIVGGALFDDGSLVRTLTAADFDANGVYTYYLLLAPEARGSVCHEVRFFEGGDYLGLAY